MMAVKINGDVRMAESEKSLESFRFVFEDATVLNREAENIDKATILAMAFRISRKKTTNLLGVLVKNSNGEFQAVREESVVINLKRRTEPTQSLRTFR